MNSLYTILKGKNDKKLRNHLSISIIFKSRNRKYYCKNFSSKVKYRI